LHRTGAAITIVDGKVCYDMRMKRTNLVLNAHLLEEATRSLGVKTYSAAVNLALAEILRIRKIQSLPQFFGRGLWQGNLQEMREDWIDGRNSRKARQGPARRRTRRR
jgi:Arc/MetJ family transcription regulator